MIWWHFFLIVIGVLVAIAGAIFGVIQFAEWCNRPKPPTVEDTMKVLLRDPELFHRSYSVATWLNGGETLTRDDRDTGVTMYVSDEMMPHIHKAFDSRSVFKKGITARKTKPESEDVMPVQSGHRKITL